EAGPLIIYHVIRAGLAIAVIVRVVRQACEIRPYRSYPRRTGVGAIGVSTELRIPIVCPRPRIGVLDLIARRLAAPVGNGVTGDQRLEVHACAAHYRLVMIVA